MGKEAPKVVLVTGAASGIGRAIALAFAEEGDSVVVADIDDQKGQEVVKEAKSAGGQAAYVRLDVTLQAEWEQAVEFTVKTFGQLTTLVNNAGIGGPRKLLEDLPLEDYMKVVNVTSTSVFLGAKAAAAELKKHPGVAAMVNIASIMSSVARDPPVFMGYSAAKGACQSMTRNMAVGWAKQGIRVNSVHPGYINTPILTSAGYTEATLAPIVSKHPMGRLGEPEEIANAVVWLASRKSSFVTGHSLFVDGGYTAL